jgi:hypothetical protein
MNQKKGPSTLEVCGWLLLPVGFIVGLAGLMLLLVSAGEADSVPPRASFGPNPLPTILERMVSHPNAREFTVMGSAFVLLGILSFMVLPLGIWTSKRKRQMATEDEPYPSV